MDPSSSKKSGVSTESGLASKRPGFFIHDNALVSRIDSHPSCFTHLTSPLAASNAGSACSRFTSNAFPPLADHNAASSSIRKRQPNRFNYLTGNGLPHLPDKARKLPQFTLLTCNGLDTILLDDEASSSAQQKQPPSRFTFFPSDGLDLSVEYKTSPSGPPKKQPSFFSFLSKPLSYANKFVFKARKPSLLEFSYPNPCFDPDSRYDLSEPILPDICVRCNQRFNLGKDGGIYMFNDMAYCSLECRQKQMDIYGPPKKKDNLTPNPVVMMVEGKKRRKTTPARPLNFLR